MLPPRAVDGTASHARARSRPARSQEMFPGRTAEALPEGSRRSAGQATAHSHPQRKEQSKLQEAEQTVPQRGRVPSHQKNESPYVKTNRPEFTKPVRTFRWLHAHWLCHPAGCLMTGGSLETTLITPTSINLHLYMYSAMQRWVEKQAINGQCHLILLTNGWLNRYLNEALIKFTV